MMNALQEARRYFNQYQDRINQDNFYGDLESRTRYEHAAYKQAMMHAAIAQAEELKRIADALEARSKIDSDDDGSSWEEYQDIKRWQRDAIAAQQMARGEAAVDG